MENWKNTQFCNQLKNKSNPDTSGPHLHRDAVALNLWNKAVFCTTLRVPRYLVNRTEKILQHLHPVDRPL